MGKTRVEIEEMLNKSDVIELNLKERKVKYREEDNGLIVYEKTEN